MTIKTSDLDNFQPAVNAQSAVSHFKTNYAGNTRFGMLPCTKLPDLFRKHVMPLLERRKTRNSLSGGDQEQPFGPGGRLEWLVKNPPDEGSIVSGLLTPAQQAHARKRWQSLPADPQPAGGNSQGVQIEGGTSNTEGTGNVQVESTDRGNEESEAMDHDGLEYHDVGDEEDEIDDVSDGDDDADDNLPFFTPAN
jgi:hypothetical protein